jgi:hypothetical protein
VEEDEQLLLHSKLTHEVTEGEPELILSSLGKVGIAVQKTEALEEQFQHGVHGGLLVGVDEIEDLDELGAVAMLLPPLALVDDLLQVVVQLLVDARHKDVIYSKFWPFRAL